MKFSIEAPTNSNKTKNLFWTHVHFSRKMKILLAIAVIAIILVSVFAFLSRPSDKTAAVIPQVTSSPTATPSSSPSPSPTQTSTPSPSPSASVNEGNTGYTTGPTPTPTLPPVKGPGLIETHPIINSSVWLAVAQNAWAYFQPGIGVDNNTWLPYAEGRDFYSFTDWDLGVYIQAIIDAQEMGLVSTDGPWGSSSRINAVLTFLETRTLNNYSYPYQFYSGLDKTPDITISSTSSEVVDIVDTGRLFVALKNLEIYNSSLTQSIYDIVHAVNEPNGGSNYYALVLNITADSITDNSIYAYYVYSGFASFFPQQLSTVQNMQNTIMTNIYKNGNVTTYGNITLPNAPILCDPLLCSLFELPTNDPRLATQRSTSIWHMKPITMLQLTLQPLAKEMVQITLTYTNGSFRLLVTLGK